MDTGRLIQERYRLQQLIKQGQTAAVYYGWDEVLSRAVVVKSVPAPYMADYRAALKLTSHFSHPNIVSMYDLVIETDLLHIVQEYIEGDDFVALMQKQMTPFAVIDLGSQLCQALLYAGSPARRIAHGDLTPSAVMRDRNGFVRVNNFALPSDVGYFQRWSVMGGDGIVMSDTELPWGTWSDDRQADDTRAVGLLLYQLLASRIPGTSVVEPRPDGRLSFQRSVPPEVCEMVARAVARQHPEAIRTPEALFVGLKTLAETLEPVLPTAAPITSAQFEPVSARQYSPAGSKLATALPLDRTGAEAVPYRPVSVPNAGLSIDEAAPSSPTVADQSLKL
ncbi:MAG TPA: protein kinase, partial [Chthonomonadales bacterium]|nr:protein kinase [Chthonomonadales bacterium]